MSTSRRSPKTRTTTNPGGVIGEDIIKVHAACVRERTAASQTQGEVLTVSKDGIDVAAGKDSVLRLLELQAAGKKRMPVSSFILGTPIKPGMVFGNS